MPSLSTPLPRTLGRAAVLGLVLAALLAALAPARSLADVDPAGCTEDVQYDPTVPTFQSVVGRGLGDGPTGVTGRNPTGDIHRYFDAVMAATQTNPRVRIVEKTYGTSVLGQRMRFYVISTPDNIANLDEGRKDGPFWAGVRDGSVSEAAGLAAVRSRPAIGWITSTPHGNEPAAGEAISRILYEFAARTDCWNARRLRDMDHFLLPVRNPDGRDALQRTSAWTFDHNRDFGTQNQIENGAFLPLFKQYPGVFFIDAHQMGTGGYFFPPNEDPVLHEISAFTLDFIGDRIGPAIRRAFDAQSISYFNFNTYDLFVPEYGDTVPSLLSGAAGMTFEKGTSESYGKQVYDHYVAIEATVDSTVQDKAAVLTGWVDQWQESIDQGASCDLQPNTLVSPLDASIKQQPDHDVCGYFLRPDRHEGDTAALVKHMRDQGVHVYRFEHDVNTNGVREYGTGASNTAVLPKGTLYMPMNQPLKHWIQAVMGEKPFEPVDFFYDVATWSYPLHRGLAGSGFLTSQLPPGVQMTEIENPGLGTAPAAGRAVYAFETDSMQALAMAFELLEAGVDVDRSQGAFTSGGRSFTTGTALVSGSSLATRGVDIAQLAARRQTPVTGLDGYPAAHYDIETPKIGLYAAGTSEPNNPARPNATAPTPGHCATQQPGTSGAANYCVALFTLTSKMGLPASMFVPVTVTDLTAGRLVAEDFTALLNANGTIAAGPAATALQTFVNEGGRYVGTLLNGTTSARNAGITTVNTVSSASLNEPGAVFSTPGSTFTGAFKTVSPVAWGFDDGGFIYRDATSNPIYDTGSLAGNGTTIPPAMGAVDYATPLTSLGFSRSATGPGKLDGRPAVVDQPFGAGRAILFGYDAFYRSWKESDERLLLNSLVYPSGALEPANMPGASAPRQGEAPPVAQPLPVSKLPAVKSRPARRSRVTDRDVRIQVARKHGAKLRRAVRAAKVPRTLRKRMGYITTRRTVTFVARNARTTSNDHDRGVWVRKIVNRLNRGNVRILTGQL